MNYVYHLLEAEMLDLTEQIRNCKTPEAKDQLIRHKKLIKDSLKVLKSCHQNGITGDSVFTKLPKKLVDTPSSEYRIVEDCESDVSTTWKEVHIADKLFERVRLDEGDVLVEL